METTEQQDVQAETLSGDIRDSFLTIFRDVREPWAKLPEHEQRGLNAQVDQMARDLVRRAVNLVADRGFVHVACAYNKATLADGIKIELTAPRVSSIGAILGERPPGPALLVFCDAEAFIGERAPAPVDKDQPGLDVDQEQINAGALDGTTVETTTIEASERMIASAQPGVLKGMTVRLDHFPPSARRAALQVLALAKGASVVINDGEVIKPEKARRPRKTVEDRVAERGEALKQQPPERGRRKAAEPSTGVDGLGAGGQPETEMPADLTRELADA